MARRVGAHYKTVNNWELGHSEIVTRYLPGVLEFLGYDPRPCPLAPQGRVRWLRQALGLSNKRLGQILGVDEHSVLRYERGERVGSELEALFTAFREHREAGEPIETLLLPKRKRRPRNKVPETLVRLGDHLRKARLARGFTIEEAAGILGCSSASILNWELGRSDVSTRKVPAILSFLGYDPVEPPATLPAWLLYSGKGEG